MPDPARMNEHVATAGTLPTSSPPSARSSSSSPSATGRARRRCEGRREPTGVHRGSNDSEDQPAADDPPSDAEAAWDLALEIADLEPRPDKPNIVRDACPCSAELDPLFDEIREQFIDESAIA
jgi:hypothetical protein